MKKTMKSIIALAVCAVAMVFASCSKDDANPADGNKEYAFAASCEIFSVKGVEDVEDLKQYQEYVNAALTKVGFTGETDYPLSISGKDSAAVSKVLLEKMAQVEKAITDAPYEINAELCVKGAEKKIIASEDKNERIINVWYKKNFGAPSNGVTVRVLKMPEITKRFVKKFFTLNHSNDYRGCDEACLGGMSDGDPVWLYTKAAGGYTKNKYVWEQGIITDVIAVSGGGEPQTLYVNGRKYTKEKDVWDLNKGCGPESDYIWIYTCREPFMESDGKYYYLNTGPESQYPCDKTIKCCRVYYKGGDNFNVKDYLYKPYTSDGHKYIERVVPMYNKDGGFITDQADMSRNAGGDWVKMILTYCTKEGGY